ncbi:MAG TPA: hypothetical protein VIK59_00780 [Verrucomicrobiae bacterium]
MRADSLTIHLNPDQTLNLQLQAATNKDYAIQTNGNLASLNSWTNLLTGATDEAGGLATNSAIPAFSQLFYRSMSLPELSATTTAATGNGNTTFPITLGGNDPLFTNSILQAVITGLPAHGQLLQENNSPITTIPTLVSAASNVVLFQPETNVVAASYDTFSYLVKRTTNGVTSPAQAVAVSVAFAPLPPILPFFTLQTMEDVAVIFPIKSYDPTPPPGAGPLTNIIITPCILGRLYQVMPDNVSQGAVILDSKVVVSNANQLLMYVPPAHASGNNYEPFTVRTENSYGQFSPSLEIPINITHVNHAPVAYNETILGNNDDPLTEFNVLAGDLDGDAMSVYFTQLPTNVTLYTGQGFVPVEVGVPYALNDFDFVAVSDPDNCLDIYSKTGTNIAQIPFYVEDSSGLTSNVATNTISIRYINTPPGPDGPTNVTGGVNLETNTDETNPTAVDITLSATDVDGDFFSFFVTSLPQHGSLYFENVNLNESVQAGDFGLPVDLTTSSEAPVLTYVPDPGYNSGQGLDSFAYVVRDNDQNPCTFTVTLTVNGPVISPVPNITVVVDGNGNYVTNGAITGFTVYPDETQLGNELLAYAIMPVNVTNGVVTAGGGDIRLLGTPKGVHTLVFTNGGVNLTGVAAGMNANLTNSVFGYEGSSTNGANYLSFAITETGGSKLSTTNYLPVVYVTQ